MKKTPSPKKAPATGTPSPNKPMTKDQARKVTDEINSNVASASVLLLDLYERDGWKALGYKTWTDYCVKELEVSRQRGYQLVNAARLAEQTSTVVDAPLSEAALRELGGIPAAQVPEVVIEAVQIAAERGAAKPTAADIKEAAAPIKEAAQEPPPKPKPAVKRNKPDDAEKQERDTELREKYLERVKDICGKHAYQAIRDGSVEMSTKELKQFTDLADDQMEAIQDLVLAHRHSVTEAMKIVNRMIDGNSKFREVWLQAIANKGVWQGTIEGLDITVEVKAKKK